MQYVRLGKSGLKITEITYGSALTIGTERKDQEYANSLVGKAWDLGIRSYDVSNNYGYGAAEVLVGAALKRYPREEYVLATKGSWPIGDTPYHRGLSRKHILWAVENSLKNLKCDYVDLYYAHRYDPDVQMEEIVRVFNSLIDKGYIRYWATSEWPLAALIECHAICDQLGLERPIAEQFLYSFAVTKAQTNGVIDFCNTNGVGKLAFSPLCQGLLTGKYKNTVPVESRIAKSNLLDYDKTKNFYNQFQSRIDFFVDWCERYKLNGSSVALLWCIKNDVFPVVGASRPEQLEDTLDLSLDLQGTMWNELKEAK